VAIQGRLKADFLKHLELCYAPQFSAAKDPINIAGMAIENILKKKVKIFHWHDIATIPKDGSVTLLDVRSPAEYKNGFIEGFKNIPLENLRDRIGELDSQKTVYLTCQVGQRGYFAARILSQKGFSVFNLSGGYKLFSTILKSS
jgi:rhodanese-related sulfurtransferase